MADASVGRQFERRQDALQASVQSSGPLITQSRQQLKFQKFPQFRSTNAGPLVPSQSPREGGLVFAVFKDGNRLLLGFVMVRPTQNYQTRQDRHHVRLCRGQLLPADEIYCLAEVIATAGF